MRGAFVRALVELAEQDPHLVLLTGDLGCMALEPFIDRFPERFYTVGVAEQDMVGLATGLAEAGFIPFVNSIATFATLRPYEVIRNSPILKHLLVRIAGIGGGFEYSHAGPRHHGLGSLVSEVVAEKAPPCRVVRCGFRSPPGGCRAARTTCGGRPGCLGTAWSRPPSVPWLARRERPPDSRPRRPGAAEPLREDTWQSG
jgi:transketolase C-terminal domain/subunit